MNLTTLLLSIFGIYVGGNWLVAGASRLARSYGVSQVFVGLTVLSLVTSAPELLIVLQAAVRGADGLLLGTIVGSNITNIGLILGLSGLVAGSLSIATGLVRRGMPVMAGLSVGVYAVLFLGVLNWMVGLGLLLMFLGFAVYMLRVLRQDQSVKLLETQEMVRINPIQTEDMLLAEDAEIVERELREHINRAFEFVRLVAGAALLVFSSDAIVTGALNLVEQVGASEVVLGSTFIALVASLPELISVFVAAQREKPDLAFGNLIGSSMTNLLLILGLATLVEPVAVSRQILIYQYPVMLVLMLYLVVVALDGVLSRFESAMYGLAYSAFIAGFFFLPIF